MVGLGLVQVVQVLGVPELVELEPLEQGRQVHVLEHPS